MAKVSIKLDKRKNCMDSEGAFPLVLSIGHKSKTRTISLKYHFTPDQWDEVNNEPINFPNSKHIGAKIRSQLSKAEIYLLEHKIELDSFSIAELKVRIQAEIFSTRKTTITSKQKFIKKNSEKVSLLEYGEHKIERLRLSGKDGNADAIQQAFKSFLRFTNTDNLYFSDVDQDFLKNYCAYCYSRGNKPNTIRAYIASIKGVINEAAEDENMKVSPFPKFQLPKATKTKNRALRMEEIEAIRNADLKPKSALWNARNYFLFMFNNMGLNFIDLVKLKKNQIAGAKYDSNGNIVEGRIIYQRSKTVAPFSIKLTEESLTILNHYEIKKKENDDFVFPMKYFEGKKGRERYKQQRKRLNRKLNELAQLLKIEEITTYYARHSWATIAKRKMIPVSVISEGLGHTNLKTTQIYLDSFDNDDMDSANESIVGG